MYGAIDHQNMPIRQPGIGYEARRPVVTTTLYHLIAGLQDCITAENDDLLVAVVHHLIGTGRIKVLSESCGRRWGAGSLDTDA